MSPPPPTSVSPRGEPRLLGKVSESVFWNSVLLPLITLLNAVTSVVIRRGFGLQSGIYDILIGLQGTVLFYSSFGIPMSLQKLVPDADVRGGRPAVLALLRRVGLARAAILLAVLVPLNLFAAPLAERLALGAHGVALVRLVSLLVVARALLELVVRSLQADLAQRLANLVALGQAFLEAVLIALCVVLGYGIGGVIGSLAAAAAILAAVGARLVRRTVGRPPAAAPMEANRGEAPGPAAAAGAPGGSPSLWRFAALTWLFELSLYFGTPAFAKPALAAVLGRHEDVALFATGYQIAFMGVTLVVAGFRGVYRPLFARLRAEGDPGRVRDAFFAVSKVQVALLLPAGIGLGIMVGDYLPLLYGPEFLPAVPVARLFVAFLFVEAAFNLGVIILWTDERWRAVFAAQGLIVLGMPVFLAAAASGGVLAAALSLGAARVGAVVAGFLLARRAYGLVFPWAFTARVAMVCGAMALALVAGRLLWPASWLEALVLTLGGVGVYLAGIRLARLLGPEEAELIRRSRIPGGRLLLAWASRR